MNKANKKIRPISILRFVWLSIWLFFIFLSVGAIVAVFIENNFVFYNIFIVVLGFVFFVVSLFIFLVDFKKGVKFDDEGIKISADVADKKGLIVKKFQHELNLKYEDIKEISIEFSKNDTHNKEVEYVFVYMPNIVLTLQDNKQERINVYYYNRRQKNEIIDLLKFHIAKTGQILDADSGKEMWDKAYSKIS